MSEAVVEREGIAPGQTTVAARAHRLTRKRLALAAAVVAVIAGAAGYGDAWWTTGRFIASTDDAYVGGNVTPIAPHVAGFVKKILVGDNQYVRAGEPVVELRGRDLRAAQAHAVAIVAERTAALATLRARLALQHSTIAAAAADLAAKSADAAFAAEDAVRYRLLARARAGSRQRSQKARAAATAADAGVLAARATLAASRQQLAVLDAGVTQAEAALAAAKADLRTAEINTGYTTIRAPIDGYVGNRAAQVGAYVAAGGYLLSIVPAHGLWVDANFKEDDLAHMKRGEAATVVADVLPGRVFHGHVESLAPASGAVFSVIPAQNATGNFTKIVQRVPVRIDLDGKDAALGLLRPGLSATVRVDTKSAS